MAFFNCQPSDHNLRNQIKKSHLNAKEIRNLVRVYLNGLSFYLKSLFLYESIYAWPSTNFYTFSFFFHEIVMCTRHPGGNGDFSPGNILARGEITISPRLTSAHDDFTEKNRFCTYINSNRNRFSEWPLMSGIEISSSRGL